jgi:hypothetical protein
MRTGATSVVYHEPPFGVRRAAASMSCVAVQIWTSDAIIANGPMSMRALSTNVQFMPTITRSATWTFFPKSHRNGVSISTSAPTEPRSRSSSDRRPAASDGSLSL